MRIMMRIACECGTSSYAFSIDVTEEWPTLTAEERAIRLEDARADHVRNIVSSWSYVEEVDE